MAYNRPYREIKSLAESHNITIVKNRLNNSYTIIYKGNSIVVQGRRQLFAVIRGLIDGTTEQEKD